MVPTITGGDILPHEDNKTILGLYLPSFYSVQYTIVGMILRPVMLTVDTMEHCGHNGAS